MSRIEQNTVDLQGLLNAVNSLPTGSGEGPAEDLNDVLTEQANKIAELQAILDTKASGEGGTDTRFADCADGTLASIDDDSITKARQYAFAYLTELKTVRLPNLTGGGVSLFRNCSILETVDLPQVTTLTTYSFQYCYALKNVNIPMQRSLTTGMFQECKELERLELGDITNISGTNCFKDCSKLAALIIRKTSTGVITLGNINAFDNTPIASGTGFVYLPSALVESHKSATNWSTYADQIRAIEDYPETTGG